MHLPARPVFHTVIFLPEERRLVSGGKDIVALRYVSLAACQCYPFDKTSHGMRRAVRAKPGHMLRVIGPAVESVRRDHEAAIGQLLPKGGRALRIAVGNGGHAALFRHDGIKIDKRAKPVRHAAGDTGDDHPAIGMTDQNDILEPLPGNMVGDVEDMRVGGHIRRGKVASLAEARQGGRGCFMATLAKRAFQRAPAPSAMPGTMHEYKSRHCLPRRSVNHNNLRLCITDSRRRGHPFTGIFWQLNDHACCRIQNLGRMSLLEGRTELAYRDLGKAEQRRSRLFSDDTFFTTVATGACFMTTILITGANGFIGSRLAATMPVGTSLRLNGEPRTVERLILVDHVVSDPDGGPDGAEWAEGDLGALVAGRPDMFSSADVVFHLASATSGECEADLDLGLNANLMAGIALGRCLAGAAHTPLLVFSSTLAIYGGTPDAPLPDVITDAEHATPQNSYGAQKLMLEAFFADLSRRGQITARSLRLMTVSVRPGRPNGAASSFLSGMIREPLQGEAANVPVDPSLRVVLNSPDGAIAGLRHAAAVDDSVWGGHRGVNLPGISVTVGEMAAALEVVGGAEVAARLTYDRDETIERIVTSWPARVDSERANGIGFAADKPFVEAVRDFAASVNPA